MSRVSDPLVKMELEELSSRLDVIEQSIKGSKSKSYDKNEKLQLGTYRVLKEEGKYYIEFKHKDGWVRSDSSNFTLRG